MIAEHVAGTNPQMPQMSNSLPCTAPSCPWSATRKVVHLTPSPETKALIPVADTYICSRCGHEQLVVRQQEKN
jgi:hypothetical protein